MTRFAGFLLSCILCFLLAVIPAKAAATELSGVAFDPVPEGAWRCGLTSDDLPGLAAEGMRQPLAAGCTRGGAKAYAVIVDLSDSRSAMTADQMAADAEDQLPTSWKIDSRSYDVVSLSGGQTAAYARLIGKGDGFTFLSGQTPMVAISFNVPLAFVDESGAARQTIAVFRVRSPIPAGASQRKTLIEELEQTIRAWAGTAHPVGNRVISARDYEVAAHARSAGHAVTTVPTSASAARPGPAGIDRIAAAMTAAMQGRPTVDDLTVLEDAEKRFGQKALGSLAHSLRADIRGASLQSEQEQILSAAMESSQERAGDVLSRFLVAAIESQDPAGVASAIKISGSRGWVLRNLSPDAIEAVAGAVLSRTVSPGNAEQDRAFFEIPSGELLPLVLRTRTVPLIEEIARRERDHWRMKDRRNPSRPAYLVQEQRSIGILERQQTTDVYRYRPLTNLLDVAAIDP